MSDEVAISIAQMNIVLGDPAANLRQLELMTADAAGRGAQLLVCPELWSTGYVLDRAQELANVPGAGHVRRSRGHGPAPSHPHPRFAAGARRRGSL